MLSLKPLDPLVGGQPSMAIENVRDAVVRAIQASSDPRVSIWPGIREDLEKWSDFRVVDRLKEDHVNERSVAALTEAQRGVLLAKQQGFPGLLAWLQEKGALSANDLIDGERFAMTAVKSGCWFVVNVYQDDIDWSGPAGHEAVVALIVKKASATLLATALARVDDPFIPGATGRAKKLGAWAFAAESDHQDALVLCAIHRRGLTRESEAIRAQWVAAADLMMDRGRAGGLPKFAEERARQREARQMLKAVKAGREAIAPEGEAPAPLPSAPRRRL
jgi:hypothetical protein